MADAPHLSQGVLPSFGPCGLSAPAVTTPHGLVWPNCHIRIGIYVRPLPWLPRERFPVRNTAMCHKPWFQWLLQNVMSNWNADGWIEAYIPYHDICIVVRGIPFLALFGIYRSSEDRSARASRTAVVLFGIVQLGILPLSRQDRSLSRGAGPPVELPRKKATFTAQQQIQHGC